MTDKLLVEAFADAEVTGTTSDDLKQMIAARFLDETERAAFLQWCEPRMKRNAGPEVGEISRCKIVIAKRLAASN
jgi:hypothetical protein